MRIEDLPEQQAADHAMLTRVRAGCAVVGLGLLLALGLGALLGSGNAAPVHPGRGAASDSLVAPRPVAEEHLLNALLVPSLDPEALPLRWADPLRHMRCGPGSAVRVNQEPLVAGALVPDTAFEMTFRLHGCRPFGRDAARFDGWVRLTVFREDWGWSAMVEPAGLTITQADAAPLLVQAGSARMPQAVQFGPVCNEGDGPCH